MTSINDTVQQSLRQRGLSGYANSAAPVVTDLVAREERLSEAIVRAAQQRGVSEQDARRALQQAGMHVAPQVTAPERVQAQRADTGWRAQQGGQQGLNDVLSGIHDTLKKIAKRTKHL